MVNIKKHFFFRRGRKKSSIAPCGKIIVGSSAREETGFVIDILKDGGGGNATHRKRVS